VAPLGGRFSLVAAWFAFIPALIAIFRALFAAMGGRARFASGARLTSLFAAGFRLFTPDLSRQPFSGRSRAPHDLRDAVDLVSLSHEEPRNLSELGRPLEQFPRPRAQPAGHSPKRRCVGPEVFALPPSHRGKRRSGQP